MSGKLRETLFQMPEGEGQSEMTVKEYRDYAKDEVAHINGKKTKFNIFNMIILHVHNIFIVVLCLSIFSFILNLFLMLFSLSIYSLPPSDDIGLHRVENPSHSDTAVSLHLYFPPIKVCRSFNQQTGESRQCQPTFYSQQKSQ